MKLKHRGLFSLMFSIQNSTGITDECLHDACEHDRGSIALMIAILDRLCWDYDETLGLWTRRGYTERGLKAVK